jgi:hypothetical protein
MRAELDRRRLDATIVILPTKGEVYRWVFAQQRVSPDDTTPSGFALAVLEACRRARFRCVDAKPFLVERALRLYEASGEWLWWWDDSHLGECGHEAVADLIAQELGLNRLSSATGTDGNGRL